MDLLRNLFKVATLTMPKYLDEHVYHVYNRGAHKARIFAQSDDYRRLIGLIKKYSKKYAVTIVAYCLMPNHYHLVVKQCSQGPMGSEL